MSLHMKISIIIWVFCFKISPSFAQDPCGGGDENGGFGCPLLEFFGIKPPGTPINIPRVHAVDPNEISGPVGYGPERWVAKKDRLGYTIFFENDPDFATAPAQIVKVNLPVDPHLNINSVRLGNFGFGYFAFEVPPNSTFYSKRLDVRDSLQVYVDVTAGIDVVKKEVFWVFESIDPATGLPPEDGNVGFLPVNDSTVNIYNDTLPKKGEGYVTFTIVPAATAVTGDTATAKASIVFDINAPIETNTWINLIDAFPPTSTLDSLPDMVPGNTITVKWSGDDDVGGVGIDYYNLYASKDGGPFLLTQEKIDTTLFVFTGAIGSTYEFYTRATDHVGNQELPKFDGEQTVTFGNLTDSLQLNQPLAGDIVCANDTLTVAWQAFGNISNVDISLSTNGGATFATLATNLPANGSPFRLPTPGDARASTNCIVKVSDAGTTGKADSSDVFRIKAIDTTQLQVVTCLPAEVGDSTVVLSDALGCDSVVITTTVLENTPPSITCPVSITISTCASVATYTAPVGTDNCPGPTTAQTDGTGLSSGSIFPQGVTTLIYTVTDVANLTSSCQFTVTVTMVDNQPPSITCPANITANTALNTCTATVSYTAPIGTDNCPGASTAQTDATGLTSGISFPSGTTILAYTVTDASNQTSSCQFTVTVLDAQAPSITCPASLTANTAPNTCAATVTYTAPVGTDNCPGATTAQTDITGLSSGSSFPKGVTILSYAVTDAANLSSSCQFTVTVLDAQAPTITCPANLTANTAPNTCAATVTYTAPVGTDNCPGATTAQTDVAGLTSGSSFPKGVTILSYAVTDAANLSSSCQFTVTVLDAQAPTITCPANLTANTAPNTCAATVSYSAPVGTDNCPGATTSQTDVTGLGSGSIFPKGVTILSYAVTDAANLSSSCQFTVSVLDAQAPTITCPANLTANTAPNTCAATVSYSAPVGTDNCPGATTSQTDVTGLGSGSVFPKGVTILSYLVTDAANLTSSCQFTVTVLDAQAPSITCPANLIVNTAPNTCAATVAYTAPVGTDNCPGATTAQTGPAGLSSGSSFPKGVTTLSYLVTDAANLTSSCQFTVTVLDTQAPSITCPANLTANTAPNACAAAVTYTAPVGTDNCPGATTVQTDLTGLSSGSNFPKGVTTLSYLVTDAANLSSSCQFNVTVIDNQPPTARCIGVFVLNLDGGGNALATAANLDNGSTDNCEIAALGLNPVQFACANVGPVTATLTATDGSGNTHQCTGRIDVIASAACAPPSIANVGGPNIADPCTCLGNGKFAEEVVIGPANSGQVWYVQNTTLINPLTNLPYAPNTPFTEIPLGGGQSRYVLQGIHLDGIGYTLSAASPYWPTTTLSIGNTCTYPKPTITVPDGPFCLNSPVLTLTGDPGDATATQSFTINGVAATVFNPGALGLGSHTIVYTVNGGTPKANGVDDPGCIQSVAKIVRIIATSSSISCNNNVQLSLDEDCRVVVTGDMVLEGSYGCYDDYQVLITGPGAVSFGNTLTGANVGQTLKVNVTHLPSGNSCWGNIKVEDKLPPVLTCADVWAVCAAQNYDPNYLRNTLGIVAALPTATDNCNLRSLTHIDNPTVDLDCNAPRINNREVSAYFVRKWAATDASGNTSTCEQFVYLERRHVWDVQFPGDVEIACGSAGNPGVPYVVFNGVQLPIFPSSGVCEFNVAATDQNLPVCDGTYKTIRTWVVYDWCLPTGSGTTPVAYDNPRYHIQVIKHVDNVGPVAQCPPALVVVSTDALKCCAVVDMPDVLVQDNCSRVNDISAMVTVRDPLNNNAVVRMEAVTGRIGDFPGNNWWTPDTMAYVNASTCLPVGDHDVVYTITDDCGNQTFCNFTLSVRDYTPPIVACDEFTVGALDGDDPDDCYLPGGPCNFAGVAYIKAHTFDDGSYDNCKGPLKFTVRRMAPYSAFVEGLNKNDGIPPCDNGSGRPTEYERATLEQDSLKIYCGEVGTTQTVILRVYQLNQDGTYAVNPGTDPGTDDDEFIYGECMVQIEVQDKVRPTCIPPAHVTVSCENFDPSLWAYGKPVVQDNCCLDESKVYQDQCGLTHTPSYAQFDTTCNKGTITRTFRVYDCHGNTGSCTQRVVVTYEEDYYVRFPDDRIVTVCDGSGQYGAPTFFGEDCELLATSFKDDTFTVVPDACFKIERTWKIINWCTYDPNCDLTHIPNPNPNDIVNNSTNLPGQIVSDRCNAPTTDPWRSTRAKINPTDAVETNYCVFWQRPAACWPTGSKFNGYYYTQIIKVIDGKAPVPQCVKPDTCDLTDNDPLFWNVDYWWDATHSSHDLCEMPVDLKLTATDLCSGPNINFRYLLFLDLDGNGTMETVVSSSQLPPTNTIYYGNALLPNYQGGTPRAFDHRLVINPTLDWYRFAIQVTRSGANATAAVRFNTQRSPNTFVLPQIPHGKHKIKWIVEDGCGNETVCEYPFEVKDCKKPTIVCKPLSVNIMQTGMVTLWASDFLEYAFDNCTPASQLKLGVTTETTTNGVFPRDVNGNPITNVTFDCSQVGTQVIHLWSEDALGNADFCAVALLVQDNMGNCGAKATIAGALTTEKNDGVEEGDVRLQGSHPALPPISLFDFSDNKGHYEFSNAVPMLSNYTVTPVKEDNPFNGVSTLDLALISRHILGTELLNSPYKIIAADANKSGTVTTFDVVEFRKLILGIYDRLPDNASWRFVDKAYIFPNPAAPFAEVFPESKTVAAIQGNRLDDNFIGVKIGDVNGSAVANNLMQVDDRTNGTLYFDLEDRIVKAGEVVEAVFRAAEKNAGYQFTLKYDGLELLDIVPGERMGMEHFAIFAKENAFTTSFNGESKGEFKVLFRAKRTGDLSRMLSVSSSITKAEAYEERDGGIMVPQSVALRFNTPSGTTTVGLGFELYQNRPNPFINKTIIGFHLPETTKAILTVYDETGKLLHRQEGDFAKGYNHFSLDQKGVSTTGLLYYKVETATHSATKKMVQTQ